MNIIYSSAQVTYFWLGSGSKATDDAMDYLSSAATRGVGANRAIIALKLALSLYVRFLTVQFRPCFSKLDELFGTLWIDCIWTFQAVMRSENGAVVCGDKSLSWVTMIQALEYIELHRTKSLGLLFPASFQPWRRVSLLWLQINPGRNHCYTTAADTITYQSTSAQADSSAPLLPQHSGSSDVMAQILQQRRNFEFSRGLFTLFMVDFFFNFLSHLLSGTSDHDLR